MRFDGWVLRGFPIRQAQGRLSADAGMSEGGVVGSAGCAEEAG